MRDVSTLESDEYSNSYDETVDGKFALSPVNKKTVNGAQLDHGKDLKDDLRQVSRNLSHLVLVVFTFYLNSPHQGWTWSVVLLGFMITITTSYQFGYNLGVLNQPAAVSENLFRNSISFFFIKISFTILVFIFVNGS